MFTTERSTENTQMGTRLFGKGVQSTLCAQLKTRRLLRVSAHPSPHSHGVPRKAGRTESIQTPRLQREALNSNDPILGAAGPQGEKEEEGG